MLTKVFDELGLKYTLPQGSYFILLVRRPLVPVFPSFESLPFALQDVSDLEIPDDYPFPASLNGRGRDFKYALEPSHFS